MSAANHEASDHTADGAIVAPSFAYGINTACCNNLHYLEEQRLLYPAGRFFVSLSADDGKSTFIQTAASAQSVCLLQMSANRRYLAAAELPGSTEQQQVTVYYVPAQKREQTLQLASHTKSRTVSSMSFSGDTKLLATLTGEPDWTVLLWRWQQAKVLITVSADGPAVAACLSLWDESLLALATLHVVKAYKFDIRTGTHKSSNAMMLDSHKSTTVTCVCHLVGGMMAVGTNTGRVMICSPTGVLSVYDISPASSRQATASGAAAAAAAADELMTPTGSRSRSVSGAVQAASPSSVATSPKRGKSSIVAPWQDAGKVSTPGVGMYAVQAVVQRGRGFVAAGSTGDVYIFAPAGAGGSRSGGTDAFTVFQKFTFADQPSTSLFTTTLAASSMSGQASPAASKAETSSLACAGDSSPFSSLPPALRVCGLTVSPTDEQLALATAAGKVLLLNIAAAIEAREEAVSLHDVEHAKVASGEAGEGPAVGPELEAASAVDAPADLDAGEAKPEQAAVWQVLASGFPTARVIGLDAAQHLPLLLVATDDGCVRVYDWMRRTRLAVRHMGSRQPLSCSLHPSGLMAAVGTNEGLAVYWVLKGALSPVAELPAFKCNVTCYSHSGGLLAAAGGSNTIFVYPAYYGHEGAAGRASSNRPAAQNRSVAAAAGSGNGSAVLEPVAVLKGHVSSVTDLVFTGDDKRLVSTGAGGAVYFWDLCTGTRLVELEYVDKKCLYISACFSDQDAAAIVRTTDGRLQHIKDGQLVFESTGLPQDNCPIAMTGDGRVVLAATSTGSIISIGWPQHPEPPAAANQSSEEHLDFDGMLSFSGAARPSAASPVGKLGNGGLHNLSVQVGAGSNLSPRDHSNRSTPRMQLQGATGVQSPGRNAHQQQDSSKASRSAAGGVCLPAAKPSAHGGSGAEGLGPGRHEYRLHASRITAIKVLHNAGIMFTASADGLVLMSSLSLVVDGVLIEPPPPTLPPSATVHGNSWALATLNSAASSLQAGLPPPLVLVDDSTILCLQDRIKGLLLKMAAMQREAQYQVMRQTQALKESLSFSSSQVSALTAEMQQLKAELEQCRQKAVTDQEQILKELEGLHLSAAEQLEGLYEARVALERERLKQLNAAKDDLEFSLKEEMKRQASAAAREVAELHSMYQQQLAAEAARTEAAAAAAAEADAVYMEVLMQTEEDLEKRAQTDSERLSTLQRTAEETQVKLRAETNILSRSNERLKAEKAADAARVAALQQEVKALHQQLTDAGSVADKLRAELGERDGVISDNYVTMQGLRRRVQELETHKFVLTYKNESAAAELQPKEEQLEVMQATVNAQDKELLAGRSALLAAQRAVAERSAAITAAKQELWEAKRKMAHQSALLDAVAHDIAYVLEQPEERVPGGKTASRVALEKLAVKYCTKRGGGPRTSVQVEAEMMAHIAAAEKKSNILERQLTQAVADKQQNSRRLMADNTHLLADVAELQRSNRELSLKLAAATRQLTALQQSQQEVISAGGAGAPGSRPSSASPVSRQAGNSPSVHKVGRSQGVRMGGQLVPASGGRYFEAALRQQWQQLADLQTALEAATGLITTQAVHLTRLQQCATGAEDADQQAAAGGQPAWQAKLSWQRPAAPRPGTAVARSQSSSPVPGSGSITRPRTAEGSRPYSASPSKLAGRGASPALRSPSPAGSLGERPATSSHLGMMSSIKSDLEAWRAK